MLEPLPLTPFSDENPAPRVCLIGPKGCGKTIYRTYLHAKARTELPDYVRTTLGIRQADLPEEGEVFQHDGDQRGEWVREHDLGLREPEGEYVPAILPTLYLTRHVLTLPSLDSGASSGVVYDFPGGYFDVPGAERLIIDALRQSRLIVMMLPYWALLPQALRRVPSPLTLARGRREGATPALVEERQAERELSLRAGAVRWLELLKIARTGEGVRPGTVLVMLTMLHREWPHELRDDEPRARALAERVRALRRLITQSLFNLEYEPGGSSMRLRRWLPFVGPEIHLSLKGLHRAARLRAALEELHDEVAAYVLDAEGACAALGRSGREALTVVRALRDVEQSSLSLPSGFRYGAMNVVSERHVGRGAVVATGQGAAMPVNADATASTSTATASEVRRYFEIERAAAMVPSLYLCGSLDE